MEDSIYDLPQWTTVLVCMEVPEAMFVRAQAASNWSVGLAGEGKKGEGKKKQHDPVLAHWAKERTWEGNYSQKKKFFFFGLKFFVKLWIIRITINYF